MANIDFGIYGPGSSQYKKSKDITSSFSIDNSYNRMVNQEIASLNGTESQQFTSIISRYPTLSRDVVIGLIRAGATADTPGIGKITSIDGISKVVAAANKLKAQPSVLNENKNVFHRLTDFAYGGLKGTLRTGFALLRSPYDYATTIGRDVTALARGEAGPGQLLGDINPAALFSKTTTLGSLVRDTLDGGGVSTGSGFFVDPNSRVGKQQAKAMMQYGQIGGKSYTLGRGFMSLGSNPNSEEFKIVSGIIDAVLNIATDPSTYFSLGTSKLVTGAAQGGKAFRDVKAIAQAEAASQMLNDVKKMPALPSLRASSRKLKEGVLRDLDNHYMNADKAAMEAEDAIMNAEFFDASMTESKLAVSLKNTAKVLTDENIIKDVNSITISGNTENAITQLGKLSADFKNTLNSFPGALVTEELPVVDKITYGAQKGNEFAIALADGATLDVVDLAQKTGRLSGKELEKEIELRTDLMSRLVSYSKDMSLPARTRASLKSVTNTNFIDDVLFNEGTTTLGDLVNAVLKTRNAHAVQILTNAIEDVWKADAFTNLRAIHGGTGGVAIVNPAKIAAKGVELSRALESAGSLYDPLISVARSKMALENATKAKTEAEAAVARTKQMIAEIEAMRAHVAKDPQLAFKLMNNPEFVDIKDIAELEAKIGVREAYKEGLRMEAGLIDDFGGKLSIDLDKANKFILGRRFAPVAEVIAKETNVNRIMRLFKNKIDADVATKLAKAENSDEVLQVLRNHMANPLTDTVLARSLALRGESLLTGSPLFKTLPPVYTKALSVMEKAERSMARVKVRSVIVPLADLDKLVKTTREWLESARVPADTIDNIIDKLARAEASTERNINTVRSKVIEDAMIDAQKALANKIAPGDKELLKEIEKVMRAAGRDRSSHSVYSNALVADGTLPGVVFSGNKQVKMDGALYVSQFLDTVVRFPDTGAIERVIRSYNSQKSVLGKAKALEQFANEMGDHWRTAMLVGRVAYILRNIGEMQIRQFLTGHETLLTNPIGYAAIMFGNPNGTKMTKFLDRISKYSNDALGNSFKDDEAEKLLTGAIEEYRGMMTRHISSGDPRAADAKVRIFNKNYRVVTVDNAEYYDALAPNLARFGVDDIMQLVARAESQQDREAIVLKLVQNKKIKINGENRNNILLDIYNASRQADENGVRVSKFDQIFLNKPEESFSYRNINTEGVYNWLFDTKSKGSYQSELNGLMGSGKNSIYIKKLIAERKVSVPAGNGKFIEVKLPSYLDKDTVSEYGALENAFKKQLQAAFPRETMVGGRAIYAEAELAGVGAMKSQFEKFSDWFFTHAARIEDVANFGPEYRMAFWDHVGRYAAALNLEDLQKLQKIAGETLAPITYKGRVVGKKHQTLRIINRELKDRLKNGDKVSSMTIEQLNSLAGKKAAEYTRELFYDASRQNMNANAFRLIFPFVQAQMNTLKMWGKLSVKNPIQIYKFEKAYNALTQPGSGAIYDLTNTKHDDNEGFFYKDEFGVMRFRYPMGNLFGAVAGLATNGKVPLEAMQLTAPVQSLNLALGSVNPGVPGIGPIAAVAYSATGRSQAFGPVWDTMRNFIFPYGEPKGGPLSVALPSWLNKSYLYLVNDSATVERGVKDWAGYLASTGDYGDNPFANNATKEKLMNDARSMSHWSGLFTALFQSIAPATPAQEVLARIPDNKGKYQFTTLTSLFKAWQDIQSNNPGNYDGAVHDFMQKYGANNVMTIISGSTRSVTGTKDAWTFLNQNPEAAAKFATGKTDIVPYFFPGGEAATAYYNWQTATGLREKLSPRELADAATELVYNMELSQISQQMADNNYSDIWYSQQVVALNNRYGGAKPVTSTTTGVQQNRVQLIGKALETEVFKDSPVYTEAKTFYDAFYAARKHLQDVKLTPEPDFGGKGYLQTMYRQQLTQLGQQLINQNPQFANMYYLVFANLLKENK